MTERIETDPGLRARLEQLRARAAAMPNTLEASSCPDCDGTGWKNLLSADGARVPTVTRCPCVLNALPGWPEGTPLEFRESDLANFRKEAGTLTALGAARSFLGTPRDLYFTGGVGTGKTRLAASLLNEHYQRHRTGYFGRVSDLLHRLQPGRDEDDVAALERRLWTVPVLVLDDIGAERDVATDYTRRTLLMVYEERGDRGLHTVWTSNLSLDQLAEQQQDDRLASRIAGRCSVVRLEGPDRRLQRLCEV